VTGGRRAARHDSGASPRQGERDADAVEPDVLIVEDEFLVLLLLRDVLEDAGLRCAAASDAEAALSLLEGSRPPGTATEGGAGVAGLRPGVLVTDVNLGPGADGLTLAEEARRRLPGLPVVYVTGNPDLVVSRGLGPGEMLLSKPFDPAVLAQEVQALAHAARRRRPGAPDDDGPSTGGPGRG
jgi:CheY-like chemotaxis protein